MGFFQRHKWEETSVEENVEFHKPAKGKYNRLSCFIAPGHGEEEANRRVCYVTTLRCPLAEVSPHTPGINKKKNSN